MKINTIDQKIEQLLLRLKNLQNSDGSWAENNFINALIACSLSEIENVHEMKRQTILYLLSQKSPAWTWNYNRNNDTPTTSKKIDSPIYPDDLDDTSCSIIAIIKMSPRTITKEDQRQITQLFTKAPYDTWIINLKEKDHSVWRDVDIGVNANIGYLFSLLGTNSQELHAYIDKQIRLNIFTSKYYHNPLITLYFISRYYGATTLPTKEKERLIAIIHQHLRKSKSPFNSILANCSLLHLGVIPEMFEDMYHSIFSQRQTVTPEPLYLERKYPKTANREEEAKYAYSEAWTIALELEMLSLYKKSEVIFLKDAAFKRTARLSMAMRQRAENIIDVTLSTEKNRGTILLPLRFANHIKKKSYFNAPEDKDCMRFPIDYCLMNLYGSIAYTIYDHIIDTSGRSETHTKYATEPPNTESPSKIQRVSFSPSDIPIANFFQREMAMLVHTCAHKEMEKIYSKIMNILDQAEYTESTENSQMVTTEFSWKKSAGYILPIMGVMLDAGYTCSSPAVLQITNFFKEYICARQTADDIRDWYEDLSFGIRTPVTAPLMRAARIKKSKSTNKETLRGRFIKHSLIPQSKKILHHIRNARRILNNRNVRNVFSDTSFLADLIEPHAVSAEKVIAAMKK